MERARAYIFQALAIWIGLAGMAGSVLAQSNGVLREVYTGINSSALYDLTNNPAFPNSPSLETVEPAFESPANWGQTYGERLRALVSPPVTGSYVFWIASDDQGALFLSTDEDPANKRRIAGVQSWTGSRQWFVEGGQQSAPLNLTNGRRYYIEALMQQGWGGDNLAVTWQKPGDPLPNNSDPPIAGMYLIPYGLGPPIIAQQPANTIAVEGSLATFTVRLQRSLGATYQWRRAGTNIPGAINSSYTAGPVTLADSNAVFSCFIANAYGSTNSASARLIVVADTTRPALVSVVNLGDSQIISALFSEPLDVISAGQATNYVLNNGASVLAARLSDDLRTVVLTTTPLQGRVNYTLTVNNIYDRAATPNAILPNSQISFNLLYSPLDMSFVSGGTEPSGPSSRFTPLVISEIMYHPATRADGRNLEFLELHNTQEWAEDISGFRLSGEVNCTFATNTVMPAKSFLVVAASPADMQAVYGLTGVLGYSNALNNASGTIRLRNRQDAILLEANYDNAAPYPVAADGAGHSLVLARPTQGEGNALAWAASEQAGGSPGTNEVAIPNIYRSVVINELFANSDAPDLDYVELFNYSAASVLLGGCILTDNLATNKYRFPSTTIIQARAPLFLDESQLGFALSSSGETVYLMNSNRTRVLDAVRFGGQAKNIAYGRYPDGAPDFHELAGKTPGTNNAPLLMRDVVINEIMFDPVSGAAEDEYVEIYNRGTNAVNLRGWRLRGGISYNFPVMSLAPDSYLVVAHTAANLTTNYPNLNAANTIGDYSGGLGAKGDTVRLLMMEETVTTNQFGWRITNQIHVVVDEVTYGGGGQWGLYARRGGSSLELIDPRSDHRRAPNWAPSDESAKSGWVTIEKTGVLDNGVDTANAVHLVMLGAGECLVDEVEVIPAGGVNLVTNSNFAAGMAGWAAQGTHEQSSVDATGGYGDNGPCLHVRATSGGDTGANRIRFNFLTPVGNGATATLRMKARWLKGWPEVLMRFRGNYLEATGNILTARNLGTPGLPNTRALANSAPAIVAVTHTPALPTNTQAVAVTARIHDPDGLSVVNLKYRLDPATNFTTVAMTYRGAGFYSANIPGQPGGTLAAFFIEAKDNAPVRATAAFPASAPRRQCLARWGEPRPPGNGSFGAYHYWLTQATVDKWSAREKLSNDQLPGTFVYNGRVFYDVGGRYSGSPWHAPGWNSPLGNPCDYELEFPPDDTCMGSHEMKLLMPGNSGGDWTGQAEMQAYWIASELGMPFNYTRYVHVYVNGQLRNNGSPVFVDSQQPNGDFMERWYPESEESDLYKMVFWYEFDDAGLGFSSVVGVSLGNFTTTGGFKKLARYRWNWLKRAVEDSENNYTNLFALVDAVNTPLSGNAYTATIEANVDVDEWSKLFMLEKLAGNWDSYGNGGGQNMYGCKPGGETWKVLIWDIDFAFSGTAGVVDMFSMSDGPLNRLFGHPPFRRAYCQAMQEAVNGPMVSSRSDPLLDARYTALQANGVGPSSPAGIKTYIAQRRSYMQAVLTGVVAPFAISNNGGMDFSTNRNIITLTGTAPLEVRTITLNGIPFVVTWTTVTNWSVRVALSAGTNTLSIQGLDKAGAVVSGASATIRVNFTGTEEQPQEKVVINEIMYNPVAPTASFIELFNTSGSNAFDLTGCRLRGVDFDFDLETIIEPNGFLVLAKDRLAFASAYGSAIPVAGEFDGDLSHAGETLSLIEPGATPAEELLFDRVAYESLPPWPTAANGLGPSLQLIDPLQDNRRAGNWTTTPSNAPLPEPRWQYVTASGTASSSTLYMYLQIAGEVYIDDVVLVAGNVPEAGPNTLSNGDFESAFPGRWVVSPNHAGSTTSSAIKHSGSNSLHLMASSGGTTRASSIYQDITPVLASGQPYTLSFWYLPNTNGGPLTLRLSSSGINTTVDVRPGGGGTNRALYTPGAPNSVLASLPPFPLVWLNEIQPTNINGLTNAAGQCQPWVELYNGGLTNVDLSEFFLSDNYDALTNWAFPSNTTIHPGEFLLVWLDGETNAATTNELHASFRVPPLAGALALARMVNALPMLMDYLNYSVPVAGQSFGSFPDGNPLGRRSFYYVTPGTTNNGAPTPLPIFINEWMADNLSTLADPADGLFQDWFELYNASTNYADLTGYYLTDNLSTSNEFRIPPGYVIPPQGYLLVWADKETNQNNSGFADLHADFKLERLGEAIGLFDPNGTRIDTITFGPQTSDVSQGRFPDGSSSIYAMTNWTPRAANLIVLPNTLPIIAPVSTKVITGGYPLDFTITAIDRDYPPQTLTYALGPGAPVGATVNPVSGRFSWLPDPVVHATSNLVTVTVTDNGSPILSASVTFPILVIPPLHLDRVGLYWNLVYVVWRVYPGRIYQVQYTEELSPAGSDWLNLGPPITGTGDSITITDTKSSRQRFYRVVQLN